MTIIRCCVPYCFKKEEGWPEDVLSHKITLLCFTIQWKNDWWDLRLIKASEKIVQRGRLERVWQGSFFMMCSQVWASLTFKKMNCTYKFIALYFPSSSGNVVYIARLFPKVSSLIYANIAKQMRLIVCETYAQEQPLIRRSLEKSAHNPQHKLNLKTISHVEEVRRNIFLKLFITS